MTEMNRRTFMKWALGGAFGALLAPAAAFRVEKPQEPEPTEEKVLDDLRAGHLASVILNGWSCPAMVKYERDVNGYTLRLTVSDFYTVGAFVRWSVLATKTLTFSDIGHVRSVAHEKGSTKWELEIVDVPTFCHAFAGPSLGLPLWVHYQCEPERIRDKIMDAIRRVMPYAWVDCAGRTCRRIHGGYLAQGWDMNELWHGWTGMALPRV